MSEPNGSTSESPEDGAAKPGPTVPSAAGPTRRRAPSPPSRRWLLFAAGGLFVALFAVVFGRGLSSGPKLPPRSVEDQEFVRKANASCARSLPALREDRERRRTEDEGRESAVAGTVERAADELQRLEGEIRGHAVAAHDQADVAGWLDDWDAYVANGRRFAEALRRGDNKSYGEISSESSELSERIFGFSKANGLSECIF